jgi:hypothetical protein
MSPKVLKTATITLTVLLGIQNKLFATKASVKKSPFGHQHMPYLGTVAKLYFYCEKVNNKSSTGYALLC